MQAYKCMRCRFQVFPSNLVTFSIFIGFNKSNAFTWGSLNPKNAHILKHRIILNTRVSGWLVTSPNGSCCYCETAAAHPHDVTSTLLSSRDSGLSLGQSN